jgi:hypothetical protein
MKTIDDRLLAFMANEQTGDLERLGAAAMLFAEVRDLRLSFQRLHRRCQRAEAAAAGKLRHAAPKTFGRGLMAWAYAEEKKRNGELEAKLRTLQTRALAGVDVSTMFDEIALRQQS